MNNLDTIGKRAAHAIRQRAREKHIPHWQESASLGIHQTTMEGWERRKYCPSAYWLQQLALAGYDVVWILTGEEKNE